VVTEITEVVVSVTETRLVTDVLGVLDNVRENNGLEDTEEVIDTDLETAALAEWLNVLGDLLGNMVAETVDEEREVNV
jgi:hypothetical protein